MERNHISQLPSARLLRSKLRVLEGLLEGAEVNDDPDREFSSSAAEVVRFVYALALDIERHRVSTVSRFGMALLCLELGRPVEARRWWEMDLQKSQSGNEDIGEEEEYFQEMYEDVLQRLKTASD